MTAMGVDPYPGLDQSLSGFSASANPGGPTDDAVAAVKAALQAFHDQNPTQDSTKDPDVYWGHGENPYDIPKPGEAGFRAGGEAKNIKASEAYSWLQGVYFHDQKKWDDVRNSMINAGLIDENADPGTVFDKWSWVLSQAATATTAGKNVTPFDAITIFGLRNPASPTNLLGLKPKTITRTSKSTNRSVDSASAISSQAQQQASSLLGRDLNPEEENSIVSTIRDLEKAHPATSTTSTVTDTKGNTTSSTTGESGYDPTLDIRDQIRDEPDYAEHQASTYYYNALPDLLNALNSAGT